MEAGELQRRLDRLRIDLAGARPGLGRTVVVPLLLRDVTSSLPGTDVSRLAGQHFAELGQGGPIGTDRPQPLDQVEAEWHLAWLELDRPPQVRNALLPPTGVHEGQSDQAVDPGIVRIGRERRLVPDQGLLKPAAPVKLEAALQSFRLRFRSH